VPDVPSGPDDPVAALRAANARLREVIEAQDELLAARDAQVTVLAAQVEALAARVAELERRLGKDSSNSSRPPSSDSPYANKPRDRSLRERGKRPPGKQPGAQCSTLQQVAEPDATIVCAPGACSECGADLAGAGVTGIQRLQVSEIAPPPPPKVTEYQVQARACERCGTVTADQPPPGVTGRAQYGPRCTPRPRTWPPRTISRSAGPRLMGEVAGSRREERRVVQQRVHPGQLLRQPQHFWRQP
jgi:hypothetical protein